MKRPIFKVFEIYEARDLISGMVISIHRDIGCLCGTIKSAIYWKKDDRITIVLGTLLTDPEEKKFYDDGTIISLEFSGNKLIKVKVPLAEILKSL